MSATATIEETVTLEGVLKLAEKLNTADQARLVAQVSGMVAATVDAPFSQSASRPTHRGALEDLGPAPSAEDIDEMRREVWRHFDEE